MGFLKTEIERDHGDVFQCVERADMGRCDAIYTPIINKWNGMRSVQLRVCDMRPAPIEDPEAFMKDRGDKFIDAFSGNILYNTDHIKKGNNTLYILFL